MSARLSVILFVLLMSACAASLPEVGPREVEIAAQRWPDVGQADLVQGRETYIARCSSCHNLYSPMRRAADAWAPMVDKMAPRAKLRPGERDQILKYLIAARLAAEEAVGKR